jgi:hypothetical protein
MNAADIAREKAIKQVISGASINDYKIVSDALDRVISRGKNFTSEEVIAEMGNDYEILREPRLVGGLILGAKRKNRIRALSPVKGVRVKRHGAWVMLWEVVK